MSKASGAKATTEPMLELNQVSVSYGPIHAVRDLSFHVNRGEIVTLIGSNGAGKTSTLRAISGLAKINKGEILFKSKPIHALAPHLIVKKRLCQAPEGRGIFLNLTVEENLDLGAWSVIDRSTYQEDLEHVFVLFPRLKERRRQAAGTLSGGELQMLAIGRSLMSHPELLLLDEPSLGLAPQMIEKIFEIIIKINSEGKTVLLVEQNALQALQIAHRGLVLETGNLVLEGAAAKLLQMDEVRKAYLGDLS